MSSSLDRSALLAVLLVASACPGSSPAPDSSAPPTEPPETKAETKPETPPPPTEQTEPTATIPTDPIATALARVPASISDKYLLSISEDRRELTIDPRPQPTRRAARSGGFSVRDSEAGGKIISLHGGPFLHGGWVEASFRERAPAERLEELKKAGYDVDQRRSLLVVDGENDSSPTLFAFSADVAKPGIVGVCSEVTIIDFADTSKPAVAVRKPVLYVQPPETTRVTVGLRVDGALTSTYPALADDGTWTVTASPDGTLVNEATGRRHRYLFWEGRSDGFELDPKRAHLVPREEATGFLERLCDRFALTADECGDMVTYWLPELSADPYSVVELVDEATYGRYARLTVEPIPDEVIRLFMIFHGSETPVEVGSPPIPQRHRGDFTVVEWGGADLDATTPAGVVVR